MRGSLARQLAGSIVEEAHYDTTDAVLGRLSARKSCPSNDFEHLSIVFEHMRDELSDTVGTRNIDEPLQEQRARAAILIVVCNRDRELCSAHGLMFPQPIQQGFPGAKRGRLPCERPRAAIVSPACGTNADQMPTFR